VVCPPKTVTHSSTNRGPDVEQTAEWIKMPLGTMVGLSSGDCVRWGPSRPPRKGWSPSPIFGSFLLWPNGWMHQHSTWYGGRPQPKGLCVRWDPAPLPKRRRSRRGAPQFSAHVYCGQTAGWIKKAPGWMKTPLGTAVDLGPGHIVLDGVPAPAKRAQQPLSFRPMSVATVTHLSYC